MILVFESSQKQFFPKDERSGVYLRLEHENGRNNPVFVASMQISSPQWRNRDDPSNDHGCSVTQEITMRGDSTDQPVPKLLFPFVHTLIFLYKDDRDTERIKAQVQYWKDVHDKVHKQFSMPEILICTWDHSQLRRLRQDLHSIVQREPQRRFSARRRSQHSSISQHRISQHRVSSRHITPFRITVHRIDWRSYSEDGLRPICNQARLALERSRQRRKASKMLFSPKHFSKFFSYSMTIHSEIQEQKQYKPFCFIGASRTGNPVTSDYEQHLKNFIFVLPDDADPDFIAETLASRFLFDHWSKNMHRKDILFSLFIAWR
ncbi:uncharacterized protein LMH87_007655 [Akanthomyces muscarius]|nr:uncharacterized protein LMH87_007655 [Akanthomyces muscarius]KAJ4161626.1 hypothetical protein LMH87_007655 [Akanthomyces muscarius]